MNSMVPTVTIERFRAAIERRLGLYFADDKCDFLAEVMRARLAKTGALDSAYLERLENQAPDEEWSALGRLLTVPETYFFRHYDQFRAFADVALRDRLQARGGNGESDGARRLSILSAGCASGEEVYSLAMMMREAGVGAWWNASVLGADINPAMIEKAKAARYSTWALRETAPEMRQKWFRPQGRDQLLDESIHSAVRFEVRNLAQDDPAFWRAESYDVIFCRNLLMYFSAEAARALIERIAHALVPGGYLFLGHAETLRGLSQDFHLCHTHDTFYYRRRTGDEARSAPPVAGVAVKPLPPPLLAFSENDTWADAIRRSTERIQALAGSPASASRFAADNTSDNKRSRWDLTQAHDLLRQEQFAQALAAISALPAEAARDADALLLKAVLCVHSGQLLEAEQVCRILLGIDELNAGAHYVLALCREGIGDSAAAVQHNQMAIYLDEGFAMPQLHLGLLARHAGNRASARRALEQALLLLQREDSSRLLLFGGGFGRDALMALCRAELSACGGGA